MELKMKKKSRNSRLWER